MTSESIKEAIYYSLLNIGVDCTDNLNYLISSLEEDQVVMMFEELETDLNVKFNKLDLLDFIKKPKLRPIVEYLYNLVNG